MFYSKRLMADATRSYRYLRSMAVVVMLASLVVFIYFFIQGNFQVHYLVAIGCFWLLFCGLFMWLIAAVATSEHRSELTYEQITKQVKSLGWLALAAFWGSGVLLFAGLIFFAQSGILWRNSIILFVASLSSLVVSLYVFILRRIARQHYELKKQQQEILDLLFELKQRDKEAVTGGTLLA